MAARSYSATVETLGARSLSIALVSAGSDREALRYPARQRVMEGSSMDDVVNRFARELADAIAAAVAENPQVEACREKARAAGFEMKVTLEAVVGFVSRSQSAALTKVTAPARVVQRRSFEVTANDRRFLRSLRIAADEAAESNKET
jgi:hypothetical protein